MNKEIENILNELYQLDPSLKEFEEEFKKTINAMIKSKPDTKFDEKFKKQLRQQLLLKAKTMKKSDKKSFSQNYLRFWQSFSLVTTAAVIILLITIPYLYQDKKIDTDNETTMLFDSRFNIEKLSAKAFGYLGLSEPATGINTQTDGRGSAMIGGGGGVLAPKEVSSLLPPEIIKANYVYEGEDIQTPDSVVEVYKRIKGMNNQDAKPLLDNFNLGLVDANNFSDLKMENLTLTEERPYGYWINVNPMEGIVNIMQNWRQWQNNQQNLQALTEKDIPADNQLINLANQFLEKYKISINNYGQPEINKDWQVFIKSETPPYIPDQLSVIYPLMFDDKSVYWESGQKTGLIVTIDIRQMKVAGVHELKTHNYQSSAYQTEQDTKRIMDLALNGGIYPRSYPENPDVKIKEITVKLGQPSFGYMQYWQHQSNQSEELFVPAYVFPVIGIEGDNNYYQKNIIIPVVKDVLDKAASQAIPQPLPEPLLEPRA